MRFFSQPLQSISSICPLPATAGSGDHLLPSKSGLAFESWYEPSTRFPLGGWSDFDFLTVSAGLLVAPDTLEFTFCGRLLLVHELAGRLVALHPGAFAHRLGAQLGALPNRALPRVVSGRLLVAIPFD